MQMYMYPLCPWGHRGEETKQLTTVTLIKKKKYKTKDGNGIHKGGTCIDRVISKGDMPLVWLFKNAYGQWLGLVGVSCQGTGWKTPLRRAGRETEVEKSMALESGRTWKIYLVRENDPIGNVTSEILSLNPWRVGQWGGTDRTWWMVPSHDILQCIHWPFKGLETSQIRVDIY